MGVKGGSGGTCVPSVTSLQLLVHAQELHAFKVPGQEPFTQIKDHVVSLEDIAPEHRFSSAWHAVLGRGPDHAGSNRSHSTSKSMVPWHKLGEAEVTKQAKEAPSQLGAV